MDFKSDLQKLTEEAKARGYQLKVMPDGTLGVKRNKGKDPKFEARLRGQQARLVMAMAPKLTEERIEKAGKMAYIRDILSRTNESINNHLAVAADEHPYNPVTQAANFLTPESVTGKAIMGAAPMLAGGEEVGLTLLQKLMGVGARAAALGNVGAAAGAVSGEGPTSGFVQGAGSQLVGEGLAGGVGGVQKGAQWLKRKLNMNQIQASDIEGKISEWAGDIIPNGWIREQLKKGTNWKRVFVHQKATATAGKRMEEQQMAIAKELESRGQALAVTEADRFKAQFGFHPLKPLSKEAQDKLSPAAIKAWKQSKEKIGELRSLANKYRYSNRAAQLERAKAYNNKGLGNLREGEPAREAMFKEHQIEKDIKNALNEYVPDLAEQHGVAKKEFARFAALRDLADHTELYTPAGDLDTQWLQLHLRDKPRLMQSRLSDAGDEDFKMFDQLEGIVRRNQNDKGMGVDLPGSLRRGQSPVNLHSSGGFPTAFIRGMIPSRDNPVTSQYINKTPALIDSKTGAGASKIALPTTLGTNELIDEGKPN